MRIYLAGPMFNAAEQTWNRMLRATLVSLGYDVCLPQDSPQTKAMGDIANRCHQQIIESDVVVVHLNGPALDPGTAHEHGFALGRGIPVISYTTDFRFLSTRGTLWDLDLMLTETAPVLRFTASATPGEIARNLVSWITEWGY